MDECEFDRQLREQLAGPTDPASFSADRSERVLAELRPRLVRARRLRRAQIAATVVAPAALVIGGLAALTGLVSSDGGQATIAGQPDAATTTAVDDAEERVTVEVTGTTEASAPPADPTSSSSTTPPSSTTPTPSSQQPTDQPTSTPSTSTATTGTPTTSSPDSSTSTSTSVPGSELVESSCGSIVVVVVQSSVELIETLPDDGYDVDVKSSGPEVEVSFEGQGHCELKAEYERGRLVTSVDDNP